MKCRQNVRSCFVTNYYNCTYVLIQIIIVLKVKVSIDDRVHNGVDTSKNKQSLLHLMINLVEVFFVRNKPEIEKTKLEKT